MEAKKMERVFVTTVSGKEKELKDPNINFTVDEVKKFYMSEYPDITAGGIKGPEVRNDKVYFTFSSQIGTKG